MDITKADIEVLLPHARALAKTTGPSPTADDASITGMAFAHVNWELLDRKWCRCQPEGATVYYHNKDTDSHGWMCVECLGITQTG
jgi:hypothetical protein